MFIRQMLLLLHVLLGIAWVGGVLFIGWGVFPAAKKITLRQQRLLFLSLMRGSHRIFVLLGIGVIISGILLGTVYGPVKDVEILFHSVYGQRWLIALMIACFVLSWGSFVGNRYAVRIFSNRSLWQQADRGVGKTLSKMMVTIAAIESVEVAGFIAIIYVMVLL